MSKQVKGVSEKIEACAKKEFLEKGYVDASLRTIAAEADKTVMENRENISIDRIYFPLS